MPDEVVLFPGGTVGALSGDRIALDLNTAPLLAAAAEAVALALGTNVASGRDAAGTPLPALSPATLGRRARRRKHLAGDAARYTSGFRPYDPTTPGHESGELAAGITASPDGSVTIAAGTGERGNRHEALVHFGAGRLEGIPAAVNAVDAICERYLDNLVEGRPQTQLRGLRRFTSR